MNAILRNLTLASASASLLFIAVGCASAPAELKSARNTYAQAKQSNAPMLAPTAFADATRAMDKAEAAYDDEGDEPLTRAYAYTADRKAKLALLQLDQRAAEDQRTANQERLASALALGLKDCAKVERVADTTVISISGAVLFEFDKAELREHAKEKLDVVAQALKDHPDQRVVIEGHTDAVGDEDYNDTLSRERADAVRAYLESQGVSSLRLTATGAGEAEPIASNDSPEGRANNRRVEIIIVPSSTASR